jgi:hypothetical protein
VDPIRFMALVHSWGVGSRRSVLRLAAGSGAVRLLARPETTAAFTRCGKPGKKCKFKNGTERRCCPGSTCQHRICVCRDGGEGCGKHCCALGLICQEQEGVRHNRGFRGFACVTPPATPA